LPVPLYVFLNYDDVGFLWYGVLVRDERWKPPITSSDGAENERLATERIANQAELYDAWLEVIDPDDGRVMASARFDDVAFPFLRMFPGTRTFVRSASDSIGIQRFEIFEVQLVAR
jgi:hypothetical protein